MNESNLLYALGVVILLAVLPRIRRRIQLSKAKHPSLAGHSRMAKRVARWIPFYGFDDARFFDSDDASEAVAMRRRQGFQRLADLYRKQFAISVQASAEMEDKISDLQFTSNYRVPFQYSRFVRQHLKGGNVLQASTGVEVIDLDGNRFFDLTGSYGVNVFGYDFYKSCIAEGSARVASLGPVLGYYHPLVADIVNRLRAISMQDEVSFHMSGTEAVMQAVRLARYHTRKKYLVRFCGAYHGWWDDVQPGVGNPQPPHETYTLKDMDEDSLRVLSTRNDIACVLVNPLQALHPNSGAPGDSSLVDSTRRAHFDRAAYTDWLVRLRDVCTRRRIVLIFDEVFVGFRLALGGAQEYFGVKADIVTYGKTLGGGLPVGVVCGARHLMKRFDPDHPADICFARGTFNSHPYVMGAMNVFLERLSQPEWHDLYRGLDELWNARAVGLNEALREAELPVAVANLSTIWTVAYTRPSRYNWMLQYYLRAEGLALSWVGTGRLIFSLNYSQADFDEVARRFVTACRAMDSDGWWASPVSTNQHIKRRILRELFTYGFRGQNR